MAPDFSDYRMTLAARFLLRPPGSDIIVVWLGGWLVGWLVGWRVGWLVGWVVCGLVGWLVCWLVGWLVGLVCGWLVGWSLVVGGWVGLLVSVKSPR